jgi:hypothetical protein
LTSFYTKGFEEMGKDNLYQAEASLYAVYCGDDPENAFKFYTSVFGKNYSQTAYLFFLNDKANYLPCKPEPFAEIFSTLNIQTEAMNGCSWEHYMEFIEIIRDVQGRLQPYFKTPISLLDAHSYVWCAHLLKEDLTDQQNKADTTKCENQGIILTELEIKLAEQLLITIRDNNSPVFYSELAAAIDPPMNPRNVGHHIGRVSALCHQLGLPLISAKVVNKETKSAGDGYMSLYSDLGIPTGGKSPQELNLAERKKIVQCKEWYRLEDCLDLHVGMPRPEPQILPVDADTKARELSADERLIQSLQEEPFAETEAHFSYAGKPKDKPEPVVIQGRKTYPRDRGVAINALAHAHFECEIDPNHPTFLRKHSERPYTEPHHLVPVAYQDSFDASLDVEENIVSLCSTCHNHIHYGAGASKLIAQLYDERRSALESAGIYITKEKLLELYE